MTAWDLLHYELRQKQWEAAHPEEAGLPLRRLTPLVAARRRAEDAWWDSLPARFEAALNTKPDDNSAAEAAVGYSLA